MFAGRLTASVDASRVAKSLANHKEFLSHGRFISRDRAKALELVIDDLETDQGLQDKVLSVFHAVTHTFNGTSTAKIVENHLGHAFIKSVQQQVVFMPQPGNPAPGAIQPLMLPPPPQP
jgi:hypothetical protein